VKFLGCVRKGFVLSRLRSYRIISFTERGTALSSGIDILGCITGNAFGCFPSRALRISELEGYIVLFRRCSELACVGKKLGENPSKTSLLPHASHLESPQMGVFAFFSYSARSVEVEEKIEVHPETVQEPELLKDSPTLKTEPEPELATAAPTDVPLPSPPTPLAIPLSMPSQSTKPDDKPVAEPQNRIRRFSWTFRSLSFESKPPREEHKHALSTTQEHEKKAHATAAFSKRFIKGRTSNSEKRAKESALIVRSLIIGPSAAVSPQLTSAYAKPQLSKIKSQLIKPKSANKVIAQLRALPVSDAKGISDGRGPIHAVCLEHTDAEEHELHFACLAENIGAEDTSAKSFNIPGVSPISLERLTAMFNDMTVVDLVTSPDLGLGQPGNGKGILAGAVPTAETVLKGIVEITPQLMALGYATGQSILPDHAGQHLIHFPFDYSC
jgi:hypothetical protein